MAGAKSEESQLLIAPVQPADRDAAYGLVLGRPSEAERGRLAAALRPDAAAAGAGLWGAVRGGRLVAAMLVERQAGNAAEIWPPQLAAEEPRGTALALLAAVTRRLADGGVRIVQALLHTDRQPEAATLREAGFIHAADLLYLVCPGSEFPTQPPPTPLRLEPCRPADRERLPRIVEATYVETRDCPALNGLRKVEEVLAGYRASGQFDPARWLIARHGSDDVGCLIVTAYPEHGTCELTYMGVLPAARGHGWGADLARHAQWLTRQAGQPRLVLAVDAANGPAWGLCRGGLPGLGPAVRFPVSRRQVRLTAAQGFARFSPRPSSLNGLPCFSAFSGDGHGSAKQFLHAAGPRPAAGAECAASAAWDGIRRVFRRRLGAIRYSRRLPPRPPLTAVLALLQSVHRVTQSVNHDGERRRMTCPSFASRRYIAGTSPCVPVRMIAEGVRRKEADVTKDDMDIVSALRTALAAKVGKDRFELWFGQATRLAVGRLGADARRAEPILPGLDPLELPPADRDGVRGDAGRCPAINFRGRRAAARAGRNRTWRPTPPRRRRRAAGCAAGAPAMPQESRRRLAAKATRRTGAGGPVGRAACRRRAVVRRPASSPRWPRSSPGRATGWRWSRPRWSPATRAKSRPW